MDSMRGQGGIQMLLGAEQEAQQIVSRARNMKMTRLRQAKDQAEGETAACRASLEEELQRKISENTGSSGWNVKRLEEETEVKIKSFKDATSSIHKNVVNMLLKQVTAVKN